MSPQRSGNGAVVVLADNGSIHGIGAGTIVGIAGTQIRIVTAKHVATFGSLRVRLDDGSLFAAHVFALSSNQDVAVIEASIDPRIAPRLHAAPIALPQSREAVYAWGSGNDGPAFEPAAVERVGAPLPDGAPGGRYALACALCHRGDSGAGVFNERGDLVGVYIGYFELASGRVHVAETPARLADLAMLSSMPLASTSLPAKAAMVASSGVTSAAAQSGTTSVSAAPAAALGAAALK